jgi:hypothetical protein
VEIILEKLGSSLQSPFLVQLKNKSYPAHRSHADEILTWEYLESEKLSKDLLLAPGGLRFSVAMVPDNKQFAIDFQKILRALALEGLSQLEAVTGEKAIQEILAFDPTGSGQINGRFVKEVRSGAGTLTPWYVLHLYPRTVASPVDPANGNVVWGQDPKDPNVLMGPLLEGHKRRTTSFGWGVKGSYAMEDSGWGSLPGLGLGKIPPQFVVELKPDPHRVSRKVNYPLPWINQTEIQVARALLAKLKQRIEELVT